jgi:hypothetical protein
LNQVAAGLFPSIVNGEADSWEVGATEAGDPQLYLMGPPPEHGCILCVSRLGSLLYVLEDGTGHVLFEHNSVLALAEALKRALRNRQAKFVTRIALFWCALREACQERYEMIGEGEELLVHVAPRLAALA